MFRLLPVLLLSLLASIVNANTKNDSVEIIIFEQPASSNMDGDVEFFDKDKFKNTLKILSFSNRGKVYLADKLIKLSKNTSTNFGTSEYLVKKTLTSSLPILHDKFNNWDGIETLETKPNKNLRDVLNKIVASNDNKALLHIALPLLDNSQSIYIDSDFLSNEEFFGEMSDEIKGIIKLKVNKNIDINTELEIKENNINKIITASRRMKANQLNYIDKGNYGILFLVNKESQ